MGSSETRFDPQGPEKAGDAAKQAYGQGRACDAFRLYFEAVDHLHDLYVFEGFSQRKPSDHDVWLVDGLAESLAMAREQHGELDMHTCVREATHRLRTILSATREAGGYTGPYEDGLAALAVRAPEVDVSDVFWD